MVSVMVTVMVSVWIRVKLGVKAMVIISVRGPRSSSGSGSG
jgi:hypothetical protein